MQQDSYLEAKPPQQISSFIELFWLGKNFCKEAYEILPDGCIDIVFELTPSLARCLVFGTTTCRLEFKLQKGANYFGIRFYPGMARYFLDFTANEVTNNHIAIERFLGVFPEQVFEAKDFKSCIELVESSLSQKIQRHDLSVQKSPIYKATKLIQQQFGNISLDELSLECNLSSRQLQRIFLENVGIAPKVLCRITRLKAAIDQLKIIEKVSLAGLAADLNYSDQSHMYKDFQLLTGSNPNSFRSTLP